MPDAKGRRSETVLHWLARFFLILAAAALAAAMLTAPAQAAHARTVVPLGQTVGIKLFSEGVLVVGLSDIDTEAGLAVAMLPQPFVTVAQTKFDDLRIAMDLTAEWDALDNGSQLCTAGLIVRTAFAEEHPEAVAAFLAEYADSTAWVNANVSEAAQLVGQYDIVDAAVAEKAIPYCNIVCLTGDEMKAAVSGYLTVLYDQNPKAVGGAMPGDAFYYGAQ